MRVQKSPPPGSFPKTLRESDGLVDNVVSLIRLHHQANALAGRLSGLVMLTALRIERGKIPFGEKQYGGRVSYLKSTK